MREIQIYILNKLRESSSKFAEFIHKSLKLPDILLINFPCATLKLIEEYGNGFLSNQEFWEPWKEIYNLADHFINALRHRFDPIIQIIPFLFEKKSKIQILPYQDDYYFHMMEQFKEQIFFLTYKTKTTNKINLEAWKELLYDDYQWTKSYQERIHENILKYLEKKSQFAVLYQGSVKDLRKILITKGYTPKIKYFGSYWRAPLEVLSYLIGLKGIENIPDLCVQQCIKEHIAYIDIILTERTIDAAHKRWTDEMFNTSL